MLYASRDLLPHYILRVRFTPSWCTLGDYNLLVVSIRRLLYHLVARTHDYKPTCASHSGGYCHHLWYTLGDNNRLMLLTRRLV